MSSKIRKGPRSRPNPALQRKNNDIYTKEDFCSLNKRGMSEIINNLYYEIKKFQNTLENTNICVTDFDIVLSLILKVSRAFSTACSSDISSNATIILGEVFSNRCLKFQNQLKVYVGMEGMMDYEEELNSVCDFFQLLFNRLPDSTSNILPVSELYQTVEILASDSSILQNADKLLGKVSELRDQQREMKDQQRVHIAKTSCLVQAKRTWDNSEYRNIQILPRWEEISDPRPPFQLRPNIVQGKYDDWMHYYDIQFRLLREDFISPLRKGISDYKQGKTGRDVRNVKIYRGVWIKKFIFTRTGICHKINFDNTPFKHYRWDHSKHLIFGSLLCLSPDNFRDKVFFATVTNRDPVELAQGNLEVMFNGCQELLSHINQKTKFVMVESLAYFEASRHILQSLKDAKCEVMPFTSHLINNDSETVNPPHYLNSRSTYDIQFIVRHSDPRYKVPQAFKTVPITNFSRWPAVDMTELDSSQLTALKMALTQEVSVIQGPPGTGKTYIGLKIVEALLKNRQVWNPAAALSQTSTSRGHRFLQRRATLHHPSSPILVMCFTNHALDQFLEGILDMQEEKSFKLQLIRVGSRSKNERIQECNLNKYKYLPNVIPKGELVEKKRLERDAHKKGAEIERIIPKYEEPRGFVPFSEIKCVIEEHHLRTLLDPVESKEEEQSALEVWLGLCDKQVTEYYIFDNEEASPGSETESSSEEESLSEDEEEAASYENIATTLEEATIDITGEAQIEENARLIDGMTDRFKEMKFDNAMEEQDPSCEQHRHHKKKPNFRRITKIVKCKDQSRLKKGIMKQTEMSKREARRVRDVYKLDLTQRYRLYKHWHSKYRAHLMQNLEEDLAEYNKLCERANRASQANDKYALETADVIGMTTTGAAKYQHILHLIKPKIVIVEEAAEVLESHIVSALNAGTQHLILIGDHKQLRPNPNEYDLVLKYKFDISLFERLVVNSFPHATLEIQHRMRPEIADIVRHHVYKDVVLDHQSVLAYPEVTGVANNLFFIDHSHLERANDLSHSNEHEAHFLVALCSYLLKQNYSPSQITVLVTYTGQLLLMKKLMPKDKFDGVRLATVDNFQGEENDIILLSLVRSNQEGSVGFLATENRVCVALSRARHGLFCIGNFQMLKKKATIWEGIVSDMERKGKLGEHLLIHCQKHPQHKFRVKLPEDFKKSRCLEPCLDRLDCGHVCPKKCHHTVDPDHKKYLCIKTCGKECPEGHPCKLLCHLPCMCTVKMLRSLPNCDHQVELLCHQDPSTVICYTPCTKVIPKCGHSKEMYCYEDPSHATCFEKLTKVIPKCGHSQEIHCSTNPSFANCMSDCEKSCPNGHPCPLRCHQKCKPCKVTSTVTLPQCGHTLEKYCYQNDSQLKCKAPCEKRCKSNHPCSLLCYQPCRPCTVTSIVEIPTCGHKQEKKCHQHISEVKCQASCEKVCSLGHPCSYKCHEHYVQPQRKVYKGCGECKVIVRKTLKCGHYVHVQCSQDVSTRKCESPCPEKLACGHKCPLLCGQPCETATCSKVVEVALPECNHRIRTLCHQKKHTMRKQKCNKPCQRKLACGHACSNLCGDPCTRQCQVPNIKMTCKQGHSLVRRCCETLDLYPCDRQCKKRLSCGHPCKRLCSEPCNTKCNKLVIKDYPCGHKHHLHCSIPIEDEPCDMICKAPLACGHSCRGQCHQCRLTHIHKPCEYSVRREHFCGEEIKIRCVGLSDAHMIKPDAPVQRLLHCMHKEVPCECKMELYKCLKSCQWNCPHHRCTRLCSEQCDRPPCNRKCPKPLSECDHKCVGLCGEPCITTCPKCDPEEFDKLLISSEGYSSRQVYSQLPCGHIISVQDMDRITSEQLTEDTVCPIQCPECFLPLSCSYRYGNAMKKSLLHVEAVSAKLRVLSDKSQMCLLAEERERLRRVIVFAFSNCSESQIKTHRILFSSFKCMTAIKKLLSSLDQAVSKEKAFLVCLLAKGFKFALLDSESIEKYALMMRELVSVIHARGSSLSFQMIHDFTSELYKLCIQAKLSACHLAFPDIKLREEETFLKQFKTPDSRLTKHDFIPLSQLLDKQLQKRRASSFEFETTGELVSDVECFLPSILNGRWRVCDRKHYYCVPACEPGSLTMKCPECEGKMPYLPCIDYYVNISLMVGGCYTDCIKINPPRKSRTVKVDIAQQRQMVYS